MTTDELRDIPFRSRAQIEIAATNLCTAISLSAEPGADWRGLVKEALVRVYRAAVQDAAEHAYQLTGRDR